ncbi:MAG: hypothetical protein ACFE0Q_05600 [Anaerolineae bacterium]
MREPDLHYEQHFNFALEEVTQNLSENLHLTWHYGLLYIDKYSDEQGLPVSVITGIRNKDDTVHHVRVHLVSVQKGAHARIDIWRVTTAGWPFPNLTLATNAREELMDIVDDAVVFCQVPYKETGSVFSWLRNMFSGELETRKRRD